MRNLIIEYVETYLTAIREYSGIELSTEDKFEISALRYAFETMGGRS